jgi:hypothetical protein
MKAYHAGRAPSGPHYQGHIMDEDGKTVAVTYDDEGGKVADLLASAPELLEALERYHRWHTGSSDEIDTEAMSRQARAAISKARGQG